MTKKLMGLAVFFAFSSNNLCLPMFPGPRAGHETSASAPAPAASTATEVSYTTIEYTTCKTCIFPKSEKSTSCLMCKGEAFVTIKQNLPIPPSIEECRRPAAVRAGHDAPAPTDADDAASIASGLSALSLLSDRSAYPQTEHGFLVYNPEAMWSEVKVIRAAKAQNHQEEYIVGLLNFIRWQRWDKINPLTNEPFLTAEEISAIFAFNGIHEIDPNILFFGINEKLPSADPMFGIYHWRFKTESTKSRSGSFSVFFHAIDSKGVIRIKSELQGLARQCGVPECFFREQIRKGCPPAASSSSSAPAAAPSGWVPGCQTQ